MPTAPQANNPAGDAQKMWGKRGSSEKNRPSQRQLPAVCSAPPRPIAFVQLRSLTAKRRNDLARVIGKGPSTIR